MSINLDQAQQTFIVEARELLQAMEQSLLQLENEPGDQDAIGAIFRAAHTIKGSAGLFGLAPIVSFTHIVEDVLDRIRDDSVAVDAALIAVLLKCGDHMLELIEVVANRGEVLQPPALERAGSCLARFAECLPDTNRARRKRASRCCRRRSGHVGRGVMAHFLALWRGRVPQWHGPAVVPALPPWGR